MAPKYKLTYFNIPALGEPIRWLLSYGNIEFEDYRIDGDWQKIKPTTPFGQTPVLEIEGKKTWQSIAICRHLGRQLKLAGRNDWDAFQIDMIVDTIGDLRFQLANYHYDENPATKAPKKEPLQKETIPFFLSRFDKIIGENGGYFVGGQLTWADIYFISISGYLQKMSDGFDFFKNYPNLKTLKAKVEAIPQIKAWIAKHPPTGYNCQCK